MQINEKSPRISIIIPIYNAEAYLEACITSIQKQTYQNLEIILVNDGSTDRSGKICDAYAKKDGRIRVIHRKNGGVSSARNEGIAMAEGEYIGFVDADDYIHRRMYEYLYAGIQDNDTQMAVCDFGFNALCGEIQYNADNSSVYDNITAMEKMIMGKPFAGHLCNKLLKTEIAKKIKLNEEIYVCEDLLYLWEYLKQCKKVSYSPGTLYVYRQNENSVSHEKFNYKHETAFMVYDKILNDTKNAYKEIYAYAVAATMKIIAEYAIIERRECGYAKSKDQIENFRNRLQKLYNEAYIDKLLPGQIGNYIKALKRSTRAFNNTYKFYCMVSKLSAIKKAMR